MLLIDLIPLPRLLLNRSKCGNYHLCTYKNAWDREKRRSKRIECNSVGTILGGEKEGLIKWNKKFLARFPILLELECRRRGRDIEYRRLDEEKVTSISDLFENFDQKLLDEKGGKKCSNLLIINGSNASDDFDTLATISSKIGKSKKVKKTKGPRLPRELQIAKEQIVKAVEEGSSFENIDFNEVDENEMLSITAYAKRVARKVQKENIQHKKELESKAPTVTPKKRGRKPKAENKAETKVTETKTVTKKTRAKATKSNKK